MSRTRGGLTSGRANQFRLEHWALMDSTQPDVVFPASSLAELLEFPEDPSSISPAFGLVYVMDDEWRWMVVLPPSAWPPIPNDPLGPRLGDIFHQHIQTVDLPRLRVASEQLDARGWLFTYVGWFVSNPWPASEGKLSSHPDRRKAYCSIFIDQATGALTHRLQFPDTGEVETQTRERPEAGWNLGWHGSIPVALELIRKGAGGAHPPQS